VSWESVIGQERVVSALESALAGERIAHAYLFHGPDGTGKRAVALAFAQALQCEGRGRSAPPDRACGRCLACNKAARGLHPDIRLYLPQPADVAPNDVAERFRLLYQNPYEVVDFQRRPSLQETGAASRGMVIYQIDRIRELILELYHVPMEGRHNVGVLFDVDGGRMHGPSANAFLKLLEEPPARTVLLMTAERTDTMLPTILSRCQRLRFDPLPAEAIEAALAAREGVEAGRAAFLARMADGSYTRALALLGSEELNERRALAVEFVRRAYEGDPSRLPALIEQASRMGREGVKQLLGLMLGWVRDLVLYRAAGAGAALVNVDQAEAVRNFVEKLAAARLEAMAGLIEEAAERLERNVHTGLVLTVLAGALGAAMRGEPRERLFAPLTEPALPVLG
jgi:DNA polymerase-3 subunit delta'